MVNTDCLSVGDHLNLHNIGLHYQQPYESILYSLYLQPAVPLPQQDAWLPRHPSRPHTQAAPRYIHQPEVTIPLGVQIRKNLLWKAELMNVKYSKK